MSDDNKTDEEKKKKEEDYELRIDDACQAGVVRVPKNNNEPEKNNYDYG